MQCFEISVNGNIVCVAGIKDNGPLDMGLNRAPWLNGESNTVAQETRLYVAGHDVAWIGPGHSEAEQVRLNTGDQVTVRIVERDAPDDPVMLNRDYRPRESGWQRLISWLRREETATG